MSRGARKKPLSEEPASEEHFQKSPTQKTPLRYRRDPNNEETFLGPISNKTQFDKVQALIQKGIDEGAELALGGVDRPDGLDKGFYVKLRIYSSGWNTCSTL